MKNADHIDNLAVYLLNEKLCADVPYNGEGSIMLALKRAKNSQNKKRKWFYEYMDFIQERVTMKQIHLVSLRQIVNFYRKLHRSGVIEKGSAGHFRYIQLQNKYIKRMWKKNAY